MPQKLNIRHILALNLGLLGIIMMSAILLFPGRTMQAQGGATPELAVNMLRTETVGDGVAVQVDVPGDWGVIRFIGEGLIQLCAAPGCSSVDPMQIALVPGPTEINDRFKVNLGGAQLSSVADRQAALTKVLSTLPSNATPDPIQVEGTLVYVVVRNLEPDRLIVVTVIDAGDSFPVLLQGRIQNVDANQASANLEVYKTVARSVMKVWIPPTATPTVTPTDVPDSEIKGAQIVFDHSPSGFENSSLIYAMNADGTAMRPLTTGTTGDTNPAWSPDGTSILFVSRRDGGREIYVMDAKGKNQRRLTTTTGDDKKYGPDDPKWLPDGKRICYTKGYVITAYILDLATGTETKKGARYGCGSWSPDGTLEAFSDGTILNTNGLAVTQLPMNAHAAPTWSVDGKSLYYEGRGASLYQIDVQSKQDRVIATEKSGFIADMPFALSPDGKILVYADRRGGFGLSIVHLDSGQVGDLTKIGKHPSWQPDPSQRPQIAASTPTLVAQGDESRGNKIAYIASASSGTAGFLVNVTGGGPRQITPREFTAVTAISWSGDGRSLAFVNNGKIYTVTNTGQGLQPITNGPSDDYPQWSPDNQRLLFTHNKQYITGAYTGSFNDDEAKGAELWTVGIDGSNPQKLSTPGNSMGVWSPDGTKIAFVSMRRGRPNIFVMNSDGSGAKQLTFATKPYELNIHPAWSPDGKQILFQTNGGFRTEIGLMNADGSQNRVITDTKFERIEPSWSPDGKQIVYIFWPDHTPHIMNLDGSGDRQVINKWAASPFWQPMAIGVPAIAAQPTEMPTLASTLAPTLTPTPTQAAALSPTLTPFPTGTITLTPMKVGANLAQTFTAPDGSYTFNYPQGWTLKPDTQKPTSLTLQLPGSTAFVIAVIGLQNVWNDEIPRCKPEGLNPANGLRSVATYFFQCFGQPGAEQTLEYTTTNGKPIAIIVDPVVNNIFALVDLGGGEIATFTGLGDKQTIDALKTGVLDIISTIRFNKVAVAPRGGSASTTLSSHYASPDGKFSLDFPDTLQLNGQITTYTVLVPKATTDKYILEIWVGLTSIYDNFPRQDGCEMDTSSISASVTQSLQTLIECTAADPNFSPSDIQTFTLGGKPAAFYQPQGLLLMNVGGGVPALMRQTTDPGSEITVGSPGTELEFAL